MKTKPYKIIYDSKQYGTEYKRIFYIDARNGRTVCECYSEVTARKILKFLTRAYLKVKGE